MADSSHIEWTDATWQPITGCTILSPGCINCYAMTLAAGRLRNHPSRKGLTKPSKAGPIWTGEVRFNEQWLDQPLRWTKPRMIFVCAHGDLFHESVPDEWIDRVFIVMGEARQHTFQVLTKRADRALRYMVDVRDKRPIMPGAFPWPLPNVWLGVSAERQQEADERIPLLLETPAAVRFVSAEPLLGPIDVTEWLHDSDCHIQRGINCCTCAEPREVCLDWIIVGGESGKNARPMHHEWAQSLRDQCSAAGVAFFFKQWGEHKSEAVAGTYVDLRDLAPNQAVAWGDGKTNHTLYTRVGKKAAGRLLDGKEHNEFPSHGAAA